MEYKRGDKVMIYSKTHKTLCPAEIIGLPGDTIQRPAAPEDELYMNEVEIRYIGKPCNGEFKIVRPSEIISMDSHNPCHDKEDGETPKRCPSHRPICKQNVCSYDIYHGLIEESKRRKEQPFLDTLEKVRTKTLLEGDGPKLEPGLEPELELETKLEPELKPDMEPGDLPTFRPSKQRTRLETREYRPRARPPALPMRQPALPMQPSMLETATKQAQFSRVTNTYPREVDFRGSLSETGGGGKNKIRKYNKKSTKRRKHTKRRKSKKKSKTKRRRR
tara:strand:- start:298 stop:1125 length:828 start_codon:yes stop_codon:yes gene_type:complete